MFPVEQFVNFLAFIGFLIFWTGSFIILYHLTRFGVGVLPKKLSAIFLLGAVLLFGGSLILYQGIDLNLIAQ